MFAVSEGNGVILNLDNIVELYTGSNGTAVVGKQPDGKSFVMQEYETRREAKEAIAMMARRLDGKNVAHVPNVVYVPSPEKVKRRLLSGAIMGEKHHHATGKKIKGHGGS